MSKNIVYGVYILYFYIVYFIYLDFAMYQMHNLLCHIFYVRSFVKPFFVSCYHNYRLLKAPSINRKPLLVSSIIANCIPYTIISRKSKNKQFTMTIITQKNRKSLAISSTAVLYR